MRIVGWNVYLARLTVRNYYLCKKHLSSTHYIYLFSTTLAATAFGNALSQRLAITSDAHIITMASFSFLFAPPRYSASLKLSVLDCTIYFRLFYTHATEFILGQCLTFWMSSKWIIHNVSCVIQYHIRRSVTFMTSFATFCLLRYEPEVLISRYCISNYR